MRKLYHLFSKAHQGNDLEAITSCFKGTKSSQAQQKDAYQNRVIGQKYHVTYHLRLHPASFRLAEICKAVYEIGSKTQTVCVYVRVCTMDSTRRLGLNFNLKKICKHKNLLSTGNIAQQKRVTSPNLSVQTMLWLVYYSIFA